MRGIPCVIKKDIRVTNIDYNMKNTTNTNSPLLNKVYTNLIDYVSEIQQEESTNKPTWITNFIAQCEQGENDFASIYKSLKDGLISQFGFETTHHLIIPEIVWANNLDEFCE